MDGLIDFSHAKRIFRAFGGSDQKIAVALDGKVYMLKFAQFHAKRTDMSTSYVNSVLSEYICSHIAEKIGLPVHKTVLGYYGKEANGGSESKVVVVGCEDFRGEGETNAEFSEFLRAEFRTDEIGRVVTLEQIYQVLKNRDYFSRELEKESIERFWDTFIVDALVGNFDRHSGNWGYLYHGDSIRLAPVYDFGSCLLPQLADEGISSIAESDYEMLRRCYVFPSLVLYITKKKTGKVGYYDFLASGYDGNCSEALLRIAPEIRESDIDSVIDETPLLTSARRAFYKKYLRLRKHMIIDKAYGFIVMNQCDAEARERLAEGVSFSDALLKKMMQEGKVKVVY